MRGFERVCICTSMLDRGVNAWMGGGLRVVSGSCKRYFVMQLRGICIVSILGGGKEYVNALSFAFYDLKGVERFQFGWGEIVSHNCSMLSFFFVFLTLWLLRSFT